MEPAYLSNTTLLPSAKDLLLAFPRLAQRAGSFAFTHLPDAVGDIRGILFNSGSVIANATGRKIASNTSNINATAVAAHLQSAKAILEQLKADQASITGSLSQDPQHVAASMFGIVIYGIGKLKNLGGVFSYLTSRWALATFATAVILNRAQFYASSREHLRLRWHVRLALYSIPIMAFLFQIHTILQTIRCQTSPDFPQMRYSDPLKHIPMDFGGEGGFLHRLSTTALWWQTDAQCCADRSMSWLAIDGDPVKLRGSMSLLFKFFLTLCVSQLFETLSCALQGRQPVPETGMTIFEHSLAFAECEAMVTSALGLGLFGIEKVGNGSGVSAAETVGHLFTRSEILQRLNVPPEVLLVCLISCLSHLSSASLAIAGIRDKVRLVNTGIWACCYTFAFLWSFFRVFSQPLQDISDLGILRFPTVCIVGFIPHALILSGIVLCSMIYGIALSLTALSIPEDLACGMTFRERVVWAYGNLQANVQFSQSSAIRIKMSEDFYTTILKIGFNVLTAASEAVYLNEGMRIQIAQSTWLERKRLDELAASIESRRNLAVPAELLGDEIARGVDFVDQQNPRMVQSPYARERRSKQRAGETSRSTAVELDSGLGLTQRKSRLHLTFEFIAGLFWLVVGIYAHMILSVFRRLGIQLRPAWLLRAADLIDSKSKVSPQTQDTQLEATKDFYLLGEGGRLVQADNDDVDVETELRKRYQHQGLYQGEEHLSEGIYRWWTGGGWFGTLDRSADYAPSTVNDDAVSVTSVSTDASSQWSDIDEGQRTPTQDDFARSQRDVSPTSDDGIDSVNLARLLNPRTITDQEEARMLSYSLQSDGPLTRSRMRRRLGVQRAQLIRGDTSKTSLEDEERETEQFIMEQRAKAKNKHATAGTWSSGAEGMGETGPQCVETSPRSSPTQYGFDDRDNGVRLSSAASDNGIAVASDVETARAGDTVEFTNSAAAGRAGRLSIPGSSSVLLKNRIELYESETAEQDHGTTTSVLKRRVSNDETSPIAEVPNELLTHILSHLSAEDLATSALVSRRFQALVTTPHAWRSAFARYFPGPDAIRSSKAESSYDSQAIVKSERRAFTRLTSKASWRSDYVLRTKLLRSLARGKPMQISSMSHNSRGRVVSPEVSYSSELFGSINHLHATWTAGIRPSVRLIHGADDLGIASLSDPAAGKLERWGFSDPQTFLQFADLHPGDSQYGLGPGEIIGAPNVMSVSQPYGMIYGQGFPGGMVYYRSVEEMRGRPLLSSSTGADPARGIPGLGSVDESITSVWIAKSGTIPSLTDGLIGMLSGSSHGVLTAYSVGSLGNANNRTARFTRGEMTARWMLSPGVPIIAMAIDNEHSLKRQAENRIWAVVLNALGELFYITKFPRRVRPEQGDSTDEERVAWMTGRTVYWSLAEPSRRTARPDPYNEAAIDGSYSPRSSWNGMCLSSAQIEAEAREIEVFNRKLPKDIQAVCFGWDMRRRLEVDFAGDDGHNAGESAIVFECGHEDGSIAAIKRYTRLRIRDNADCSRITTPSLTAASTPPSASPSMFGPPRLPILAQPTPFSIDGPGSSLEQDVGSSSTPRPMVEEWRISTLSFGTLKKVRITTTAIDSSIHAVQTQSEDPLLNFADVSVTSSPSLGPWLQHDGPASVADIPGQRARLIGIGTHIGQIVLWNIREPSATSADIVNELEPMRIITTDSPQISSLAMTSLYLVHGGSDGLVQTWDPLASDLQPIRTLNSRFSSRARRQLIQAQASAHGVGTNMYAAGAICLDTDPTVLRGVVSLGNRLRYWAYSSSAADQYKSSKRRLRRGERGSNQTGDRYAGTTRTNLKDYIASERYELENDRHQRRKQADHLAGRFGTTMLDGSEEELVAYASMLSQESLAQETLRRSSDSASATDSTALDSSEAASVWSSDNTATPAGSPAARSSNFKTNDELDSDIAEAIRQSLYSAPVVPTYDISVRTTKSKARKGSSTKPSPRSSPMLSGSSRSTELSDMEFAIQLSLAEEASRSDAVQQEYPSLGSSSKGKHRQSP